MSDDLDRQLEGRTHMAMVMLERLCGQMADTVNTVQHCAHLVRDAYRENTDPAKVGHAETFRMRFALEQTVEGLRDELTRSRRDRTEHIAMLEKTISDGRIGLAEMLDEDPTSPRVAVRRHHISLLEQLLARNAAILEMCANGEVVVKEADEIILEVQ